MHKAEIERAYMEELLGSNSGRWLLRNLIAQSGCFLVSGRDNATTDAYNLGRRNIIMSEIVQKIVKDFGYKAIDTIMETRNVSRTDGRAISAGSHTAGAGTAGTGAVIAIPGTGGAGE